MSSDKIVHTYSFSFALPHLDRGKRIMRQGWNGKNMYLFLVLGKDVKDAVNHVHVAPDKPEAPMEVLNAIYMKTADNKLVPWLASQTDILATDWVLLDDEDE